MSNIESAGRATVLVCITCRPAAAPADTHGADTPAARALDTDACVVDALAADALAANEPRPGLILAEAAAAAAANASDILVQRVRCLANCDRGLSAAIRCDNAWTYVFGGLEASRDGLALIAGARLLAGAADGIMPWRGRPEPLKRGLIARIPPGNFHEELP
jgi:predicted metal-binding protein